LGGNRKPQGLTCFIRQNSQAVLTAISGSVATSSGWLTNVQLINADSQQFIKNLPDNPVDLIITDPPYYRLKAYDWESESEYLAWLDEFLNEFWRVLRPAVTQPRAIRAAAALVC